MVIDGIPSLGKREGRIDKVVRMTDDSPGEGNEGAYSVSKCIKLVHGKLT